MTDPALLARRLLRRRGLGALATRLTRNDEGLAGTPYASLVEYACDLAGQPLLLLSDLADHSRNLRQDASASLLVEQGAVQQPLTQPRVTLVGRVVPLAAVDVKARYLARHPGAALYASFKDFHLYRLELQAAHLVAGFGRIHWLTAAAILAPPAPALAAGESALLAQHAALRQVDPDGGWQDLGKGLERFDFPAPALEPAAWNAAYAALQNAFAPLTPAR